jgi:predicted enzyme related to lactoylglutathione lyase
MIEMLVNVDVDDLDRAVVFYTCAFGFEIGRRFAGSSAVELLGGSSRVYLLAKATSTPSSPGSDRKRDYQRHWTPVHLDVVVDDIDAAVSRAVAAGAVMESKVETHSWGKIAPMADPFGHGLCLLQFVGRGYDEIAEPSGR